MVYIALEFFYKISSMVMKSREIIVLYAIAVLFFIVSKSSAAEYPSAVQYIEQDFDVLNYSADVNLTEMPSLHMKGVCRTLIRWTHRAPESKYYFNLRSLVVDSVLYNGSIAECSAVLIPDSARFHYEVIPTASDAKDTATITIFYSGTMADEGGSSPWGGVHATETGIYAMGAGFFCSFVSSTQFWLPVFDHPQDKATFDCRFTVPAGKAVASNGTLQIHQPDNGTDIYEWTHKHPCATYLLTFAADDYVMREVPGCHVPVVYFTLAADTAASEYAYRMLPKAIEAFESKFIPYPFEKVGYVNTILGSMEHQTMVSGALSVVHSMYSSRDSLGCTPPHEISHHWFGDLVTCRDFRDAWLNEGFASFCEGIWYEYWRGFENGFLRRMNDRLSTYINYTVKSDGVVPLYDYPRDQISNYPETIYSKGAVVVGMLRYTLGDSLFFGAIKKYLTDFAFSTATTEDLKNTIESFTGRDLSVFFDQWIYRQGYPEITVNVDKRVSDGKFEAVINVSQYNPKSWGTFLDVPVELGFRMADGTYEYRLYNLGADTVFASEIFGQDFKSVNANKGPSVRALAKFRTVNYTETEGESAPVSIKFAPIPASDRLTVSSTEPIDEITIVDIFGNVLLSESNINELSHTVRLEGMAQGAYVATVRTRSSIRSEIFSIIK